MLQEKRISSKINYDVLKSLNVKSLDVPQTPTKETSESSTVLTKRPESISLFGSPERRYAQVAYSYYLCVCNLGFILD
jgi:hypothetical protein